MSLIRLNKLLLSGFLLFYAQCAGAAITSVYYVADGGLRSVAFDGTQFVSTFDQLEVLSPNWTAMSYDSAADRMYYVADGALRSVGFDGTQFLGTFDQLEVLSPNWTAMSYDSAAALMYYVADGGLRSVGFDGTQFVGTFDQWEVLSPNWTAMSLVFDPIPEPTTIVLLGLGLAGVATLRRRINRDAA